MRRKTDTFTLILTNVEELVGDGNLIESRLIRACSQTYAVSKGSGLSKKLRKKCLRMKIETRFDRIEHLLKINSGGMGRKCRQL